MPGKLLHRRRGQLERSGLRHLDHQPQHCKRSPVRVHPPGELVRSEYGRRRISGQNRPPVRQGRHFSGHYDWGPGRWEYHLVRRGSNAIYAESSFQPSDVVTMIRGPHILHFGGEILALHDNSAPWGNIQSAKFNFSGDFTQKDSLRWQQRARLRGLPARARFSRGAPTTLRSLGAARRVLRFSSRMISKCCRISPSTWAFVIRCSVNEPEVRIRWACSILRLRIQLPTPLARCGSAATTAARRWRGEYLFLPRVGVAWSPARNWAVRGGFGIYSYPWSIDTYSGGAMGFGTNSTGSLNNSRSGAGAVRALE